ncbi:hypothetical protein NPIL_235711 [Nephila pilipes]|uniref:Uncharacterized protein n=1 Tax=Nephila pilipes TaxID=299642 RepID=A0A8X6MMK5_NEPPI|nr:hypothetical protein NPIL_235711 [Nephila pilipes]
MKVHLPREFHPVARGNGTPVLAIYYTLQRGEVMCDSAPLASIVAPRGGGKKQMIWKGMDSYIRIKRTVHIVRVGRSFVMFRTTGCLTGGGHELVSEDSKWSRRVGLEQWCLLSDATLSSIP